MALQAHAVLPYEDTFLIMGGLRCPPSECTACGCSKCQRTTAINKLVPSLAKMSCSNYFIDELSFQYNDN